MNYENLRKFFNELTDNVYRERIVVLSFIIGVIFIKSIFYFLNQQELTKIQNFKIVEVASENQTYSTINSSNSTILTGTSLFPFE